GNEADERRHLPADAGEVADEGGLADVAVCETDGGDEVGALQVVDEGMVGREAARRPLERTAFDRQLRLAQRLPLRVALRDGAAQARERGGVGMPDAGGGERLARLQV